MPLPKRAVTPEAVSRRRLPPNVRRDELECIANGTLANLVRQMSCLSRHAEDAFGELYRDAVRLEHRANTLAGRVGRLAAKVTQLDSNDDDVALQDLHLRKPFKSNNLVDQQSLNRQTLPTAMSECYERGDLPPELDKMNPYRDDTRAALKHYTDPEYFFDLWRKEMLNTEHLRRAKQPNKVRVAGEASKKRPRQPTDHRQKYFENARAREMIELPPEYQTPEFYRQQQEEAAMRASGERQVPAGMVMPAETTDAPLLNGGHYSSGYGSAAGSQHSNHDRAQMQQPAASSAYHYHLQQQPPPAAYDSRHAHQSMQPPQNHSQQDEPYEANDVVIAHWQQQGVAAAETDYGYDRQMTPVDELSAAAALLASPSSSGSGGSRSRPSQPPPAPPPLTAAEAQSARGQLFAANEFGRMTLDDVAAVERGASPDLPPPPPPLSPDQIAQMAGSVTSATTDVLPSPPATDFVSRTFVNGRVPPPPPPPPMQLSGGSPTAAVVPKKSGGVSQQQSDLLMSIRNGISLKKVDRQKEKEREREAICEGHDVAAILRRRMQHVLGQSDDESDEHDESCADEWDDD